MERQILCANRRQTVHNCRPTFFLKHIARVELQNDPGFEGVETAITAKLAEQY